MDAYHVAAYRYLRDNAKPVSERDAFDLREVRAPQPPSSTHICTLKRDRSHAFHDRAPERKPMSEEGKRALRANEFYKRQMARLGGTRTVAPTYADVYFRPEANWRYVPLPRSTELWPEAKPFEFMTEERACQLARDHMLALAKAGIEVDMFNVLRVWDDFEQYRKAVENALR